MDRWVDRRKDEWMDGRQVNRWMIIIIIINLANRINTLAYFQITLRRPAD